MERYLKISKINLKYNLLPHLLVCIVMCLAAQLFMGTKNLEQYQVAKIMEGYLSLWGIVLLIPVFIPDMNKDIRDLIASKKESMTVLHIIRIIWAVFFMIVMECVFLLYLKWGNCIFDFWGIFYGMMANALFLGGMGMFVFALSDQVVFAYMIPLMYYVVNFGAGFKQLGSFWLFSMQYGSGPGGKHYLLISGILLTIGAVFWRKNATFSLPLLFYNKRNSTG